MDPGGERTLFSNPDITIFGWRSAAIVKNKGSNIQSLPRPGRFVKEKVNFSILFELKLEIYFTVGTSLIDYIGFVGRAGNLVTTYT